jgi:Domain of unknown function (DUF5666)
LQESSMEMWEKKRLGRLRVIAVFVGVGLSAACGLNATAGQAAQQAAPNPAARPVGTIKTITGKTIVLTTDAGTEVTIQVQDDARVVRIEPGAKDLKSAAPLQLEDLQAGDRILIRGAMGPDGKTVLAASVIAMKSADIATKQQHERDEWQRHGVGGLVTAIDAASGMITISTNAQGAGKEVKIQVAKQTLLRRYAPNSVKFDDAKPAPIDQIKVGDQLRARGSRNADGTELAADEVVSGTFRNIAGTVSAVDAAAGTVTVMDLVAKKAVTVKVTSDSQLRKLPPAIALGIAMRLKGTPATAPAGAGGSGAAGTTPKPAETAAAHPAGGQGGQPGGAGRTGGDLQQALSRMPAVTLPELQKGDAVMIVATGEMQESSVTAITLLAGVEPILQASPTGGASNMLAQWSLGSAPAGGDAAP